MNLNSIFARGTAAGRTSKSPTHFALIDAGGGQIRVLFCDPGTKVRGQFFLDTRPHPPERAVAAASSAVERLYSRARLPFEHSRLADQFADSLGAPPKNLDVQVNDALNDAVFVYPDGEERVKQWGFTHYYDQALRSGRLWSVVKIRVLGQPVRAVRDPEGRITGWEVPQSPFDYESPRGAVKGLLLALAEG